MKATVESIHIKNFKAFQDKESFEFDNKNVLAFGTNGSGKSSLYWALYTFLQSSIKDDSDAQKYFRVYVPSNSNTHQSLRNVFVENTEDSFIEIVIKEDNGNKKTYKIEESNIPTHPDNNSNDTSIQELNLASDFFNHKLLHNFYRGSHKVEINAWSVFERDIFPYLVDSANRNWIERIKDTTRDVPRTPRDFPVRNGSRRKQEFVSRLEALNDEIEIQLNEIERNANDFIKDHFFDGLEVIEVKLSFEKRFEFNKVKNKLWEDEKEAIRQSELSIKLKARIKEGNHWKDISRPHSFLNESMLTRIAISIRVGVLRTRVQSTQFKILVFDDMLISLDMSNRMKVIKMILGQQPGLTFFDNYQKIILTHDKGFYELIKRHTSSTDWKYFNFDNDESNNEAPVIREDYDWLEKAQMYLQEGKIEEAGLAVRKETEIIVSKALRGLNDAANTGKYHQLSGQLSSLKKKLTADELRLFKNLIKPDLTVDQVRKMNTAFENDPDLDQDTKDKIQALKVELIQFLIRQYELTENTGKLITDIQEVVDRIMNPSAHASLTTLYPGEMQDAIDAVTELKGYLDRA
tara:strand:- start:1065 stop:2795 length:1731 start_codon:yes stop_codon:yes gene_type:complete